MYKGKPVFTPSLHGVNVHRVISTGEKRFNDSSPFPLMVIITIVTSLLLILFGGGLFDADIATLTSAAYLNIISASSLVYMRINNIPFRVSVEDHGPTVDIYWAEPAMMRHENYRDFLVATYDAVVDARASHRTDDVIPAWIELHRRYVSAHLYVERFNTALGPDPTMI